MLKLTQVIYEYTDTFKKKLDSVTEIYREEVRLAESTGLPIPKNPVIKPHPTKDFTETKHRLYISVDLVKIITQDIYGGTVISDGDELQYNVTQTPLEVYKLRERALSLQSKCYNTALNGSK